jgi:hypothetical protein
MHRTPKTNHVQQSPECCLMEHVRDERLVVMFREVNDGPRDSREAESPVHDDFVRVEMSCLANIYTDEPAMPTGYDHDHLVMLVPQESPVLRCSLEAQCRIISGCEQGGVAPRFE